MRSLLGSLAILLALPLVAQAEVRQPSGEIVPRDSMNGERQLYSLFSSRGEAIDFRADAQSTPDTFSPLCEFTATLLLAETGSSSAVGWYNVQDRAPTDAEIYEIVPAGAPVGTEIRGASIRDDPRYLGGEIGFALVTYRDNHHTEDRWNTLCNAGPCAGTPGPWALSLTYLSTVTPNAFYVAFEDGPAERDRWNNDGDFNDYVFFFTGLVCGEGGEPCDIEDAEGICASGITDCQAGGEVVCRQVNTPTEEECDGVDNNCDGTIDEGDGLCPEREVCSRGQCVPSCAFEFGCFDSEDVCQDNLCIDADCAEVTCPDGQVCREGSCVAPCDGVVCPAGRVCRVGACVDPCAGVACGPGLVCDQGACVDHCSCRPCAGDLACGAAGVCVDPACAALTCPTGLCEAGVCIDNPCDGAVCPRGQVCDLGECIDVTVTEPDAGIPMPRDAGTAPRDAGAPAPRDARAPAPRDAGLPDTGPGRVDYTPTSTCGCRTPGPQGPSTPTPLLLLIAGAALLWHRRRP